MDIREFQNADMEGVLELLRLNTPEFFAPQEQEDLKYYLEREREYYFVAEKSGEIIACGGINVLEPEREFRISWDMVHPSWQGKGVGNKLLTYRLEVIKGLRKGSRADFQVIVRTSQLAAGFYEKAGFKLVEVVKDYWAEGLDMWRMKYL